MVMWVVLHKDPSFQRAGLGPSTEGLSQGQSLWHPKLLPPYGAHLPCL